MTGPRTNRRLAWLCAAGAALVACGEPLALDDRSCGGAGDCLEGWSCDRAVPGGRCREPCAADGTGCAGGAGCDRGFCVPGWTAECQTSEDGTPTCGAAGYECVQSRCVAAAAPLAVIRPQEVEAPGGTLVLLDGSESHPAGAIGFAWRLESPAGLPGVLGDGAAAATVALALPVVEAETELVVALVVTTADGVRDEARARILVGAGSPVAVELVAVHPDGSPVDELQPARPGSFVDVIATASSLAGPAWVTGLALEGTALVEDASTRPDVFRFSLPPGCPDASALRFRATAEDVLGNLGEDATDVPITGDAEVGFRLGSPPVPVLEADGTMSVEISGVPTVNGEDRRDLSAGTVVEVLLPQGSTRAEWDEARGSWLATGVPRPCATADGGTETGADLLAAVDARCGSPVAVPFAGAVFLPVGGPYVRPGAAGGDGTPERPFGSLLDGLAAALDRGCGVVGLAVGTHLLPHAPESNAVDGAIRLVGGLDPTTWLPASNNPQPGESGTVIDAGPSHLHLRARGAGLEHLALVGACQAAAGSPDGEALLEVEDDASIVDVAVERGAPFCFDLQVAVHVADGAGLVVERSTVVAIGGREVRGVDGSGAARLQLIASQVYAAGSDVQAIDVGDSAEARVLATRSEIGFTALGNGVGIDAGGGGDVRLELSSVAGISLDAIAGVEWVAVDLEGANAILDRSLLLGGMAERAIGLELGPGSRAEVFGGTIGGGEGVGASGLAIGVRLDGGDLRTRHAGELDPPGPRGTLPEGASGGQAILAGGIAKVSVGLGDCGFVSSGGCAGPGWLDVRRAVAIGAMDDAGAGIPVATAAGVGLSATRGHFEDVMLVGALVERTAGTVVDSAYGLSTDASQGDGLTLVHAAAFGSFTATAYRNAAVRLQRAGDLRLVAIKGSYLAAGEVLAPALGVPPAPIVTDEVSREPFGLEKVASSRLALAPDRVALAVEGGRTYRGVVELGGAIGAGNVGGTGHGTWTVTNVEPASDLDGATASCDNCINNGDAGKEDPVDIRLHPRLEVPDVGPFEIP